VIELCSKDLADQLPDVCLHLAFREFRQFGCEVDPEIRFGHIDFDQVIKTAEVPVDQFFTAPPPCGRPCSHQVHCTRMS